MPAPKTPARRATTASGAAKATTSKTGTPRARTTRSAATKPASTSAKATSVEEAAVVPEETSATPAPRLPYRLLTGPDTREFCERVSAALADGYILYGSPSVTFNGKTVIAAQAVVLPYAPPAPPAPLVDPYAVPAPGFAPYGGAL